MQRLTPMQRGLLQFDALNAHASRIVYLLLITAATAGISGCGARRALPTEPVHDWEYLDYDAAPTWSPGGQFIAYLHDPRDSTDYEGIAIVDTMGSAPIKLLEFSPSVSPQLAWSPSGTRLAYYDAGIWTVDLADGSKHLWVKRPDASGPAWSPDGRFLLYSLSLRVWNAPDSSAGMHILDTQTGGQRALMHDDTLATVGFQADWSPDGGSVAFDGGPGGSICTVTFADSRFHQLTHLSGGYCADPRWSTDGRRIYFHFFPQTDRTEYWNRTSWVVNADGTGARQLPIQFGDPRVHISFQYSLARPDDKVAYVAMDSMGKGGVVWTMSLDGRHKRQITAP